MVNFGDVSSSSFRDIKNHFMTAEADSLLCETVTLAFRIKTLWAYIVAWKRYVFIQKLFNKDRVINVIIG